MKKIIVLLMLLSMASCAKKVAVQTPDIINAGRYSYIKSDDGRLYILANTSKDFDEAIKKIQPGPSSVDKWDVWVITPLAPAKNNQSR
jgi:hypothetical protein